MISWLVGVVVCVALLAGCGGGQKGALVKVDPAQPEMTAPLTDDGPDDATLTEELSAKRLEELYAKSGIPGWDPSLEQELKNWEHQVKFDVPIQMNKQVRAYLVYFSTERKEVITALPGPLHPLSAHDQGSLPGGRPPGRYGLPGHDRKRLQ